MDAPLPSLKEEASEGFFTPSGSLGFEGVILNG